MSNEYFHTDGKPGPRTLLRGLHTHVADSDVHSYDPTGWQCDVGPGDIAYTYEVDFSTTGSARNYLAKHELPFETAAAARKRSR